MADSSFTFKLNSAGIRGLLTGGAVQAELMARAERVAAAAGPGMEVSDAGGSSRARAIVRTATFEAMKAEATDRALTRAIGVAR